nr:MAG TPA: hypothetical protein [Caudoviricetes sp.]
MILEYHFHLVVQVQVRQVCTIPLVLQHLYWYIDLYVCVYL